MAPPPPPFSTFITEEEEEEEEAAAATLGFCGLSFSQLLTEDPPPMPQQLPPPRRPFAAADLGGEGMLDFGRRQYMWSPPHPQLPTVMHAPTTLRTFHYEAKPDSCAYLQPEYQSSLPQELLNPFLQPTALIAGVPSPTYKLFHEGNGTFELVSDPYSDQTSQMLNLVVEKPPGDGHNWRKYGQKQVKGGELKLSRMRLHTTLNISLRGRMRLLSCFSKKRCVNTGDDCRVNGLCGYIHCSDCGLNGAFDHHKSECVNKQLVR